MSARDAAKSAGKMQAKLIESTASENARRRSLDLAENLGMITASVAASNIQMSGSAKRYRNAFEANYRGEMAWDKQKARLDARMARKTGQAAGKSAMYSGITAGIGFAGQGYSAYQSHSAANAIKTGGT